LPRELPFSGSDLLLEEMSHRMNNELTSAIAAVVEKEYLPQSRAKKCKFEYDDLKFAFRQTFRPHLDMELVQKVLNINWFADAGYNPADQK